MATFTDFSMGLSVIAAPTSGAFAASDAGVWGLVGGIAIGLVFAFCAAAAVVLFEDWVNPDPPSGWDGTYEEWRNSPMVTQRRQRYDTVWFSLALAAPLIAAVLSNVSTRMFIDIAL